MESSIKKRDKNERKHVDQFTHSRKVLAEAIGRELGDIESVGFVILSQTTEIRVIDGFPTHMEKMTPRFSSGDEPPIHFRIIGASPLPGSELYDQEEEGLRNDQVN